MIKVSVIMAVYNMAEGDKLIYAVQSILKQTYTNFEFIICDDASTDDTYQILSSMSSTDKRIKLLRNDIRLSAAGARNRCIDVARGQYIMIMDSDDVSDCRRLEVLIKTLDESPQYSFVGSRGQYFNESTSEIIGEYWFCERPQKEDFLFTLPFVHASLIFRKEALQIVGGYSEGKLVNRSEDYDLLMRMYQLGMIGINIFDILYFIRLDKKTYKRRKYIYRINEAYVKFKGFYHLGLMPKGIFYAFKPLFVGLIPIPILKWLKKKYYSKRQVVK